MSVPVPYSGAPPAVLFQAQIASAVMQGWQVEYASDTQVVLVGGKECDHLLHAIISFFLCGLWIPVWITFALTQKKRRMTGTMLPDGEVEWT